MITDNHFSLFGLPSVYVIDEAKLNATWRDVAALVHPDRFATASAPERQVAMQWSARANEAYRILRDPLARARYMCEQEGIDLQAATNTAMLPKFLMQQMIWHEQLDEAREQQSSAALDALEADLCTAQAELSSSIAALIDNNQDFAQAGERVREWMFIKKIAQSLADYRKY